MKDPRYLPPVLKKDRIPKIYAEMVSAPRRRKEDVNRARG